MSFYGDLSKFYKYIFPAKEPQLSFFKKHFREHGVKKVLDVACGTGEYTREFAAWGMKSYGIDIQREMIEIARERAKKEGLPAFFETADMLNLPYHDEEFHGVICIGNSLVHLLQEEEILKSLQEMYRVLVGGGLIIIQTVNYDRALKQNVRQLPTITNKTMGIEFKRYYHFRDDGNIDFCTVLSIENEGQKSEHKNTVILKPLLRSNLNSLLMEAGFKEMQYFGNFKEEQWSENSFATVVKAIK